MNKFSRFLCGGAAALVMALASLPSSAQIVKNGSFENPELGDITFSTLSAGLTDWTIGGTIDLVRTYWAAQDGSQSVDLNGNSVGSLTQSVDLDAGQYNLSFWLSGNPDGPPDPKTLEVSIGSLFATTASVARPTSISTMNWTPFSFNFTVANAGTYDLLFQSTSIGGGGGCSSGESCFGPVLDNVAITTAIPEPEIYAMMGLGLGLVGWVGRRRKLKAV